MVHLDYRDARAIYTQIMDGFREQIRAGVLQPGERMPSVRELAAQLAINPNTIQRAYRELESEGLIVSVAGKGSFVSDTMCLGTERETKLREFEAHVAALLAAGIDRESLAAILMQGGNDHA